MGEGLRALLAPRSVAILGASSDWRKISGRPIKHLLDKGYGGAIYPVNPKHARIGALPCYPSVEAIPGEVDLAVVVLPAAAVIPAFAELGRKRVPAAVVFSSGFGETGPEGKALEAELRAAARAAGVRLCGPNCLGLINAFDRMVATFSQYADGEVPAGPIGFVTQSGAFGTAIAALARNRGLGLGYFVNTGNEADVDFVDAMREVIRDPRVRVGCGYIEGLKNGRGLVELAELAMQLGKPLVLCKVGRRSAGARAAASHTGSLAGEDAVFDGVVRQLGILRARNEEHMLDLAEVLAFCSPPQGRGVAIATQSGGAGVLMADRAEELGLAVPVLAPETQQRIMATLPGFGVAANPIDVTGQFVAEPAVLRESVLRMLEDPQVHVGVVWLQLMAAHVDSLLGIFDEVKARTALPFVVCWVAAPERAAAELRRRGIACLRGGEPAIDALAGLVRWAEAGRRWIAEREAVDLPALALPAAGGVVPTADAAELLRAAGVAIAPLELARDADEAVQAAERLGYPVALKVESPDILHKTDAKAVRLGLADAAAVREAYSEVVANSLAHRSNARIDGVVVQKLIRAEVEFVLGLKNDPVFGAVLMAGLGGVLVEVLADVAFRRCPIGAREAGEMLESLHGKAILGAVRGRAPVDRAALVRLMCAVSRFGAAAGARLAELDLNPVLLSPAGAVAVDAVLVLAPR
jgi:acyl-CoA synthetase (NDP forming)